MLGNGVFSSNINSVQACGRVPHVPFQITTTGGTHEDCTEIIVDAVDLAVDIFDVASTASDGLGFWAVVSNKSPNGTLIVVR